ncbi:hypothetical protein C8Q75DRAFT_736440 [Abortiporus biennis]|nr:hypothetical protein C8Q75DRAFT_736440 [Abortiporus biennis]
MTNWSDPGVQAAEGAALAKMSYVIAGVYFWEFVITLDFDWEYLSGKRTFRWPMIFYFLNRYLCLLAFVVLVVVLSATSPINCNALWKTCTITGNLCVALACANLSVRMYDPSSLLFQSRIPKVHVLALYRIAIWEQNKWVAIPIGLLNLGLFGIICTGTQISSEWVDGQGCAVTKTDHGILVAMYSWALGLDNIVLCLTIYKLMVSGSARGYKSHSQLVRLLIRDGVFYFVVAFLFNVVVVVLDGLSLNSVMSTITNIPDACFVSIAAMRAVRNLQIHILPVNIFNSTNRDKSASEGNGNPSVIRFQHRPTTKTNDFITTTGLPTEGVHVQMDTFTVRDDQMDIYPPSSKTEIDSKDGAEYAV